MNTTLLLTVLNSVMGGRGKRSRRANRFLRIGGGRLLSHPATLMTAAGVAWGVFETLKGRNAPAAPPPPPAPTHVSPADDSAAQPGALRMLRVAVSAAAADGALNEREKAAILQQAGTEVAVLEAELARPRPLAEITAGVDTPEEAATLYVLAFTILRADEQVTGAERIYLAQLAHLLKLDAGTVQALERDTGDRIDALGDQGQPGG
jgi:uncharacterized membrane protein YebE (DUF533 family)